MRSLNFASALFSLSPDLVVGGTMLPTLQWYIAREMGKTFVLTAVGLSLVFALGGGLTNLVKIESVTPSQLLRLLAIIVPMFGTLTLPVAALYSATVTYGRISADNEFLACQASGINIRRLFLPPVLLSLLVAFCTFYSISFLIPGMVRDLDSVVRAGIRHIVEEQLKSPQRLSLQSGAVRIYTDRFQEDIDDPNTMNLAGVAYVKAGDPGWELYGTAAEISLRFDMQDELPRISGAIRDFTFYNRKRNDWVTAQHQEIPASTIPRAFRPKVKFLNLRELYDYRDKPQDWPRVSGILDRTRRELVLQDFFDGTFSDLRSDGEVTLTHNGSPIVIKADRGEQGKHDGRLTLTNVHVTAIIDGVRQVVRGKQASLGVESNRDGENQGVLIITRDVTSQDVAGNNLDRRSRERIGGIQIGREIRRNIAGITDREILDGDHYIHLRPAARELRIEAIEQAGKFVRKVRSELHSRLAFSISSLVLVMLGAALGIIYRGTHVMTAFGISFVPLLIVIVSNIMGRQLAENEGTVLMGICLIWGAIFAVGVADFFTLSRVAKR